MIAATLAALGGAALFAVAAALQHRSAGQISAPATVRPGMVGFLASTLRHPLWLIGSGADLIGLCLHAVALRDGPLALVQPLLVTGVVFALPLGAALDRARPSRRELAWAGVLVLGLVVFLGASTPVDAVSQRPDRLPTLVTALSLTAAIGGCCWAGRHRHGRVAAVALGTGAGLAFAASACLLKETMVLFDSGLGTVLRSAPVYALMVVGALGLALNQFAYEAGPLRLSLPVITTVDPMVSLVIGVCVFDDRFRHSARELVAEVLAGCAVFAAGAALARLEGGKAGPPDRSSHAAARPPRPARSESATTATRR